MKLEQERKFLVQFPESWDSLSKMFNDLVDVKRIEQMYLTAEPNKMAGRVRKTVEGLTGDTSTVYHYNIKNPVKSGVNEETEREISKSEYNNYLKQSDPNKILICKTRFVFKFKNQVFELDIFKEPFKDLAILEIELNDINDDVILPDYLDIIEEVTNKKEFNNFNLASKKH